MAAEVTLSNGRKLYPRAFYGHGWRGRIIRALDWLRLRVERALVRQLVLAYGAALLEEATEAAEVVEKATSPAGDPNWRPEPISDVNFGDYVAKASPDRSYRYRHGRHDVIFVEVDDG